jgi:hypothetical protein
MRPRPDSDRISYINYGEIMKIIHWILIVLTSSASLIIAQDEPTYLPMNPGTPIGSRPEISPDYFQQGIYYIMDISFNPESDIITGSETLTYVNNSPDTLQFVYFHLYQNAFIPGSYQDIRRIGVGDNDIHELEESQQGGSNIASLEDANGESLNFKVVDTNMKVWLNKPLPPGGNTIFSLQFTTKFSDHDARMHKGDDYYVATHWYPRMAVYDFKRGWNNDFHLGREFYGDFGTFEWNLTLPAHYIVDGTGRLLNRDEVMPIALRQKIDITQFKDKDPLEPVTIITEPTDETKTWVFKAEKVHDVAWIASPSFRIGIAEWDGIKVYSYAREQNAAKWQDAAHIGALFIEDYSIRWGRYSYHKMIVSDVEDGMEYPMLTADSGGSPGYIGLLGHEIGHNWFYGLVGSNETYRAFLDEGFTNFITAVSMDSIWGQGSATQYEKWYASKFYPRKSRKYIRNDLRYMRFARSGFEVDPLNTHSDYFNEYSNYRLVYSKTASMLFNLQYTLGTETLNKVMQTYFSRFLFQHPYPEDFIKVAEEVSDKKLDWFFHQWLDQTITLDYAITDLKSLKIDDRHFAKLSLKRKGKMEMPLDIQLTLQNGETKMVHIPNQEVNQKELPESWYTAKRWVGWNSFNNTYTVDVPVSSPVVKAQIDPSGRLTDIYRLDNVSGTIPPINWQSDNMYVYYPTLDAYDVYLRPTFSYNKVDGFNPGIHWKSGYMLDDFYNQYHSEGSIRYRTASTSPEVSFFFETPIDFLGELTHVFTDFNYTGLYESFEIGYNTQIAQGIDLFPYHDIQVSIQTSKLNSSQYTPEWQSWEFGQVQSLKLSHGYYWAKGESTGDYIVDIETSINGSDFNYNQITLTTINNLTFFLPLDIRTFSGWQSGSVPSQVSFRLNGASFFNTVQKNWFYSGVGIFPDDFTENSHIHSSGGGNIRSEYIITSPLKWMTAINVQTNPSSFLENLTGYDKVIKKLKIQPLVFVNWNYFKNISDETETIFEAGVGLTRPLTIIPPSLGEYVIRFDGAVPVWGKDAEKNWVFSLEKTF